MAQSQSSRTHPYNRIGTLVSIIGILLILLSLFLPIADYSIYTRPHEIGPLLQDFQQGLADYNSVSFSRNLETGATYGLIFIVLPYLTIGIILVLNCFALFIPLNRFCRGLYLLLLIVGGLALSPYLLFLFIGTPLLGFLAICMGFICMCVGYRITSRTTINDSSTYQQVDSTWSLRKAKQ